MITQEQIRSAAKEHGIESFSPDPAEAASVDQSEIDFTAGANWVLEQQRWIPVEEALPQSVDPVAIVYNNPFFGIMEAKRGAAWYSEENKKWYSELTGGRLITIEVHNVTHWQPLPNLPKP